MKFLPRYTSAYTLIEVLVALTIIGFLFGFGYVSFRDFSRRQSLAGAAKNLQGDLRLTQEQALAGQKPDDPFCNSPNLLDSYGFDVVSANEYKIEIFCTGGSFQTKDVLMPSDISLSTPSVNPIKFKAIGQGTNLPANSSVDITLTQKGTGSQVTVTVGAGGQIQ